jgi:hypothetical protein
MKRTIFAILMLFAAVVVFYSITENASSNTTSNTQSSSVTCCLDASCFSGCSCDICSWHCYLYSASTGTLIDSCSGGLIICCTIPTGVAAGDYYFKVKTPCQNCTGSTFHCDGRNPVTDTVVCNCSSRKKK